MCNCCVHTVAIVLGRSRQCQCIPSFRDKSVALGPQQTALCFLGTCVCLDFFLEWLVRKKKSYNVGENRYQLVLKTETERLETKKLTYASTAVVYKE